MAALFNYTYTIHGPQCRIAQNFQREVLVLLNMLSLLNVLVAALALRARAANDTTRAQINNIPLFTPKLLKTRLKAV